MADDFLERFASKVEMHKFIDDLKEGEQVLVLRDGASAAYKTFGGLTVERAIFMCRCFEHWVLTEAFDE